MTRGETRKPRASIVGCLVSIGYVDIFLQDGGLLGDIFNNQFRVLNNIRLNFIA